MAGRGDPALDAVLQADRAVLHLEGRTLGGIERALHRLVGLGAVVGMQAGQEHVVVDRRIGRQAEQRAAAVVPQQSPVSRS